MNTPLTPPQAILLIIAGSAAFHLIIAATLGLGVDESYGIGIARYLDLSYFDHPPLHYWIAHLFMPILGDGRAARLPFVALFAASGWLLYRLTCRLFSAKAGIIAVLALNLSAFFTFSGGWILPDGPLLFALLAAALCLARLFFPAEHETPSPWREWLAAGFWIGIAGLSKYHAMLFVIGLLAFVASVPSRRRALAHPARWVGAILALIMVSPVIVWNMQHDWLSVRFQGERGLATGGVHIVNFLANIGGQVIWILPWIFVPLVMAAWHALRAGRAAERSWYCVCLAVPAIAIFTLIPLWGDRGLPHWQMPGWLMLYPVLGDYAVRQLPSLRVRRWLIISGALLVTFSLIAVIHAATGIGRMLLPVVFAKGDPMLENLEWRQLPAELAARGLSPRDGTFIISTNALFAASKIDLAFGGAVPIVVVRNDPKHFGFRYDPKIFVGRDAIVIGRVDTMPGIESALRDYFETVEALPPVFLGRSGMHEIELSILRALQLKRPLPAPYWRR